MANSSQTQPCAPRVTHLSWGRLETEDGGLFKDAKLYPGGAREWNWAESGTRHSPGIQTADVEELIERGARTVVLSQGMWERLRVRPDTLKWLNKKGVAVHVLPTPEAVELYNRIREAEPVGGLIHSTC